jgi:BirA family biotin operon repressor/biotin-[acetyl-CoA-carboxylase] ligase
MGAGINAVIAGGRLRVEQVRQIDSTNSELLRREPLLPPGERAEAVWLTADTQTGGRGRRQRPWLSTPQASLTASFGREVTLPAAINQAALSLVAGVAVAQTLAAFGVAVRLKWPNDIHVSAGKAGGILCEARVRGGTTRLVIGCGLNLLAPDRGAIDQPAAGLFDAASLPDRPRLVEALGTAMLAACDEWLADGFAPFRERWSGLDMLLSKPILIHDYNGVRPAVARGIDADGALKVELPGQAAFARVLAEEVSVRPLNTGLTC